MDSYVTGDVGRGAIYRALPVYRIKTPIRVKTPDLSLRKLDYYCASFDRVPMVTIPDENSDPVHCVSPQHRLRKKKRSNDNLSHRGYFAQN